MGVLIPGLPDDMGRECLSRVAYSHFPAVGSVCRLWRQELLSPDFDRLRKSLGLTRQLVALTQTQPLATLAGPGGDPANKYAFTPSYCLTLLDPTTSSWHSLPPPAPLSRGLPLFCQLAGTSHGLVLLGGWDPDTWVASDAVFVYDFLAGTWRQGAPIPGPMRSFFACASDARGQTVYVAGGHDEEKNALRSALAYDVAADRWDRLPDMARERDECKGLFAAGRFHVVGGYSTDTQGRFGRCSQAFDVAAGEWGPVEEGALEVRTCPRTCVAGKGRMFRCRGGKVAELQKKQQRQGPATKWVDVADIPSDARLAPQVVGWGSAILLLGSGGHTKPTVGYVLEPRVASENGTESFRWTKLQVPQEFTGQIQAACCIEI